MNKDKLEKLSSVSHDVKELLEQLDRAENESRRLRARMEEMRAKYYPLERMSSDEVRNLVDLKTELIKLLERSGVRTLLVPNA